MMRNVKTPNYQGNLQHQVPMANYVSWRAGGIAEMLYEPTDQTDLVRFLQQLPAQVTVHWLGLGSNVLVRDGGLRGVVIRTHGALRHLQTVSDDMQQNCVYAEAGVPLPKIARFCANHGFAGAEFMAGIPGTVGGALAMNAGCYGSETWQVTTRVLTVNRLGVLHTRERNEFHIAYREAVLKQVGAAEWYLGGYFSFMRGDVNVSRNAITALLRQRIASQPLNLPNAGSVFRNPSGDFAARLIEACGLKGHQIGGAQVSTKHANFIINLGQATATDIEDLIMQIQHKVEQQTGVCLIPEVRIIGERTGVST